MSQASRVPLKRVETTDSIRENPRFRQAVEFATERLEDVVGESADHVEARWSLTQDENQRPVFDLTITDPFSGEVSADFAVDELENDLQARHRFTSLWGDLLQLKFERVQRDLHRAVERLGVD